jgi:hypothetical protein
MDALEILKRWRSNIELGMEAYIRALERAGDVLAAAEEKPSLSNGAGSERDYALAEVPYYIPVKEEICKNPVNSAENDK